MLSKFFRSAMMAALLAVLPTNLARVTAQGQADQPAGFPLSITDDAGYTTSFSAPPRRVVSLSPGYTEDVFALGHGDSLVAVDTYSDYPAAAKAIQPRLGTFPSPSIESIVALQPDLVLSLAEKDDDLAQLRAQGIPVLKFFPRDYNAAANVIQTLGRILGSPDAGDAVAADMLARRDAVVATVAGAPRPRVYEELDGSAPDKPYTVGPNGFYGQLIDLAGGDNIFGDLPGDTAQVSSETIVQRDPEVIILTDSDVPFNAQTPDAVAARPGWSAITAVRNGTIYPVPGALYSTQGPRLAAALEDLARLLHPDLVTVPSPAPSAPSAALLYR
jgi:iron complex transport system substrate-binding protein